MKRTCLLAASAWVAAAPFTASAAEPLSPTAKWVVDYAEHQCVASRSYGTADVPLALAFKPSPLGDVLQFTVVKNVMGGDPQQAPITIRIGDHSPIEMKALAFNATRAKARMYRVNLPMGELDRMADASTLSVEMDGGIKRTFVLSQMKAVAAELTKCVADLRNHWNIGPENEAKFKSKSAGPNLASFFKDEDYPDIAIRNEQDGVVRFALLIDEAGKVADCTLIETSNVPLLDAQSCAILMTRAKLTPAIGLDGKPIKDARASKVTWSLGS